MDRSISRNLARASRIPPQLQRELWNTNDRFTQLSLAENDYLERDIEKLILGSHDEELAAHWSHSKMRRSRDIDRVCSWATQESTLIALAGLRKLSTRALSHLVAKATPQVAAALLDREDLGDDQRAALVSLYLEGVNSPTALGGRVASERLGSSPLVWARAIQVCWPRHVVILGNVPRAAIDDSRVQDEALKVLTSANRSDLQDIHAESAVTRCVKMLAASSTLSVAQAWTLARCAAKLTPELAELAKRRARTNLPSLLEKSACKEEERCAGGVSHVKAIVELLESVQYANLPLEALFVSAINHVEEVGAERMLPLATQLRGDKGRDVLVEVERVHGSDSIELLHAVRLLGVWPGAALVSPAAVFRRLAQEGWDELSRSYYLPVGMLDVVALNYVPVGALLGDANYAQTVCKYIDAVDPQTGSTALALMDQWGGSLSELLESSRSL